MWCWYLLQNFYFLFKISAELLCLVLTKFAFLSEKILHGIWLGIVSAPFQHKLAKKCLPHHLLGGQRELLGVCTDIFLPCSAILRAVLHVLVYYKEILLWVGKGVLRLCETCLHFQVWLW